MAESITVQVVYALPDQVFLRELQLPGGATVGDALAGCGLGRVHPELDLAAVPVGIHGRRVERSRALGDGDRVEVYRPLHMDPMQARRRRAGRG